MVMVTAAVIGLSIGLCSIESTEITSIKEWIDAGSGGWAQSSWTNANPPSPAAARKDAPSHRGRRSHTQRKARRQTLPRSIWRRAE